MLDRIYTSSDQDYKFGFNGMLEDSEIKGNGNSLDFGARIYDSRIGRFLSVDPLTKKFSYLSPYVFAANSPIVLVDVNGEAPGNYQEPKYDVVHYINGKQAIDMTPAKPSGGTTYFDAPRNAKYFWNKMLETSREMFSDENIIRINDNLAPIID